MPPRLSSSARPSVALAHDYLTQRGGAERVALELARALDPTVVVTSAYDPRGTFDGFASFPVRSSFLAHLPVLRKDPRKALPLLPFAWRFLSPVVDADVVVCSSSGWAHAVRTTSRTAKIVYCHNPARWLYQTEEYLMGHSFGARLGLRLLRPLLISWDRRAARDADLYIANSTSVAARIEKVYGRKATVVFPPVMIDAGASREPVEGIEPGFFLTVGRRRGYKGTETLIKAFAQLPDQRLVIVGAGDIPDLPANVISLGHVSDAQLRWLYREARALTSVSFEDFGLTPVEANALGTPVLVLRAGGFLDSTAEGVSGRFIEKPTVASVVDAVSAFPVEWDSRAIREHAARFSQSAFKQQMKAAIASLLSSGTNEATVRLAA